MSSFAIESLESRTLMADTIATLAAQVATDVAAIKASVTAAGKTSSHDQHILAVDLHKTGASNAELLKTLGSDYKAAIANLHTMQKLATTIGGPDTKHAAAAAESALKHNLAAKTVAKMNAALAKLSADDNQFVSASVVNAFYAATGAPATDENPVASANAGNATVNADLPAIETDAGNLTSIPFAKFDALVMDVSAFATYITNNVAGAVF